MFLRYAVAIGSRLNPYPRHKLNNRVSLRWQATPIGFPASDIAPSGSTVAKPSVDYIPAGDFAFLVRMPLHADSSGKS